MAVIFTVTSCSLEPDKIADKNKDKAAEEVFSGKVESSSVSAKNFLQINNTYSSLTGVSAGEVASEFESIKMQLPSSSNPESLNGFNQIASTRLGFLYCDKYIDKRDDLNNLSNENAVKDLIESFIDADIDGNQDHKNLYTDVLAIMNDDDSLINDSNRDRKKVKLLKLSCTALLASSYITLL